LQAQAFWIVQPGVGEIRRETLSPLDDGQVRVRTLYSAVSRGTEALVFQGKVPPSQYERMRAPFQEGDFPAPIKYGYSSVGEVIAGPPAWLGRRVFCLYPHQTLYQAPVAAVTLLPENLPPGRAVLAANLETAVNGVWDLAPRIGDRIAVIGAGTVGVLAALLCRGITGCTVQLIDSNPAKAAIASQLGLEFALPGEAGQEFDGVIHASAAPAGLALALARAGFEATVVELSWYGDRLVPLPLGEDFHSRRLTLRSSQVSAVSPAQRRRWNHQRRLQLALELLCDPAFDPVINAECDFAALPQTLAGLARGPSAVLCQRVRYPA